MHLQDRLTIDTKRRTHDGYLTVNARVAKADNVQTYLGSEVGRPDLDTVRVFRPAAEVFAADTMQSFAHRPVTLGHPSSGVSSKNWKDVAKGWSDGEVARDGDFIRVSMLLADADTIQAVESGTRELSMGYDCTLDWTAGVSPSGEAYDAIQRGIRSNHIACVQQARGGPELRIGDSSRKELHMMTDAEQHAMKASVKGMQLDQAAALPIYDNVRGLMASGMPAEKYYAILDGATADRPQMSDAAAKSQAAYDHMVAGLNGAWRDDHADRQTPALARDGRALADLNDRERVDDAYQGYVDSLNGWWNQ